MADRFDLRKDILFNTRVTAAVYDEAAKRWSITTDTGDTFQAQYLISCAGMLSAPLASLFAGQDEFKGQIFHTARWPKEPVDFTGKRVGVIGTARDRHPGDPDVGEPGGPPEGVPAHPAIRDPDEQPEADRRGPGVLPQALQRVAPPRDADVRRLRLRLHVRPVGGPDARGAPCGHGGDVGQKAR